MKRAGQIVAVLATLALAIGFMACTKPKYALIGKWQAEKRITT